jgi:predicted RNA methylase
MINRDKPHLWKADIERSIDLYNDWFLAFAPEAYRTQRLQRTKEVLDAFDRTKSLTVLTPQQLLLTPEVLPVLRMSTAPPIARDRLSGLAHVSRGVIDSLEGKEDRPPRLPPRMKREDILENLTRISGVIVELLDDDLFPWLNPLRDPAVDELRRAAAVVADRLTGATADPIIRNAQEQRQLSALQTWLRQHGYTEIASDTVRNPFDMPLGTYSFHLPLLVGGDTNPVNIPIDCAIKLFGVPPETMPVLIEAKSAGDFTNTNKRRKEEAQKFAQLKATFGAQVIFILLLGGYFEPGYLGYEAAEGIDWIWEHRIGDLSLAVEQPAHRIVPVIEELPTPYLANTHQREARRAAIQREIDSTKSLEQRNRLGQYATPFALARQIVTSALAYLPSEKPVTFIEPALGTGVFYSALLSSLGSRSIHRSVGVELDADYAQAAQTIWSGQDIDIHVGDFLDFSTNSRNVRQFNLLCTNPPYIRHHHIASARKLLLQTKIKTNLGLSVSGLSGLYLYFMLLADSLLADDAIASWLVPSEFLVVNYGKALRYYLTSHVTLLELHQFDIHDVQFDDALVSSCIVTYAKRRPSSNHRVRITFGADMIEPGIQHELDLADPVFAGRWTMFSQKVERSAGRSTMLCIGDLFDIKRGIATGANDFFILDRDRVALHSIPEEYLKPILPSPRLIHEPIIGSNQENIPLITPQLFLLACDQPPEVVQRRHPELWNYLRYGVEQAVDERYLCRSRDVWYYQERRIPSRFLASYMGRSNGGRQKPIRFFLNRSNALVTNVYLHLYPKAHLAALLAEDDKREIELLDRLNSIPVAELIHAGRSYGGGLHKLEPKELASIPLVDPPGWLQDVVFKQLSML